jgi:hypothetical protein
MTGGFPRRDQIDRWMRGEDGANCLLIAVALPSGTPAMRHRQITSAEVAKQPDCSNATCHGCR